MAEQASKFLGKKGGEVHKKREASKNLPLLC